jgi:WD40 repeat protein
MRRFVGLVVLGLLAAAVPAWWTAPGEEPRRPGESGPESPAEGERDGEASAAVKPVLVLDGGGHTAEVNKVLFTPDGKQVVTVSKDKTVRVWDAASGQTVRVLRPPIGNGVAGELYAGALSPDGQTLAVAGWGVLEGKERVTGIYLMPLTGGKMRVLKGHKRNVHALAFSPDGKLLASAGVETAVRLWDVEAGTCQATLSGHTRAINALAFSPDGARLATAANDQTVRLWSVATGKTEFVLGHPNHVFTVAWSPDGRKVYSGGKHDPNLHVWDAATGKPDKPVNGEGLAEAVMDVTARDGSDVLFSWRTLRAQQHYRFGTSHADPATGEIREGLVVREGSAGTPIRCALSPDGRLAATSGGDNHQTSLWTLENGKVVQRLVGRGRPVFSAGWSSEGPAVAWGVPRRPGDHQPPVKWALRLGDLTLSAKADPKAFGGPLLKLGTRTLERVGPIRLEVREGDKTLAAVRTLSNYDSCTLLPGDLVAVGVGTNVSLFDARTGKRVRVLAQHLGPVFALAPSPNGKYLVTGSTDETIRIWDPRQTEPLLSVFAVGSEWVAWTPEGYYAASPGGERLMGWHVNNGTEALASFYPASRFRASLYRPDVIQRLLSDGIDGNVKKALEAADKARGQSRSEATEVADVLPPSVTLAAPKVKDGKTEEAAFEVEAAARGMGKHPVKSLQLLLDGRPYEGGQGLRLCESARPGETVKEAWKVELTPGEHTLRVLARSAVSTGLSDEVEVTYARPVPKPALYVLAVGIDGYKDRNLKLNCAVNDAAELAKTFAEKSRALFDVRVKVLRDREATRAGILAGLKWLKEKKPQDLAVVFYAGHGDMDDKGRFYLLPQDVDVGRLAATGVSGDVLKQQLVHLPGRVVLMLDACHSGSIGRVVNDLARDLAGEDSGVVVMCAAMDNEKAGEQDGHGYFCRALIEGLDGKAARNPRDGYVYFHHLEQYVTDRVPELSKDEQHATTAKPSMKPLPLARPKDERP